jgi:hypothetical protein
MIFLRKETKEFQSLTSFEGMTMAESLPCDKTTRFNDKKGGYNKTPPHGWLMEERR